MRRRPAVRAVMLLAAACLLSIPGRAAAQSFHSGNDWLEYCNDGSAGRIACINYAPGVADTIELWRRLAPNTAMACIPPEVTGAQLKDVGQQFMTVHAKDRHYPAVQLLTAAFTQAWPCPTHPSPNPKQ